MKIVERLIRDELCGLGEKIDRDSAKRDCGYCMRFWVFRLFLYPLHIISLLFLHCHGFHLPSFNSAAHHLSHRRFFTLQLYKCRINRNHSSKKKVAYPVWAIIIGIPPYPSSTLWPRRLRVARRTTVAFGQRIGCLRCCLAGGGSAGGGAGSVEVSSFWTVLARGSVHVFAVTFASILCCCHILPSSVF